MYHFGNIDITKVVEERIPSSTSKGNQPKWYIQSKGFWIKQDVLGYEGISEFLSSLVLEHSTLPPSSYVVYRPCKIIRNGVITSGSVSKDFKKDFSEVTIYRLLEAYNISEEKLFNNKNVEEKFDILVNTIKRLTGLNSAQELSTIFAFDAIILNEDRHLNNIILLTNGLQWRLAPIFDNGLSLLSDTKDYPERAPMTRCMLNVKAKPLSTSFSKQLSLYKGEPFIYRQKLLSTLDYIARNEPNISLGRAGKVLRSQLNNRRLEHLFID